MSAEDEGDITSPEELLIRLATLKQGIDALNEQKALAEAALVDALVAKEQQTITATHDGMKVKGTLVQATRIVMDETRLKGALGATLWNKVTKRVLDKQALEAHVATGAIDAVVVASCSEEIANKPYVKVTGDNLIQAPIVQPKGAIQTVSSTGRVKAAARKRVKPKAS